MELRVGAGTVDGAGIEHGVARTEQGDIRPDRLDDPGGVEAQDAQLAICGSGVAAQLGVDGIDGNRLDPDQQVAAGGGRTVDLDVDQRVGVGDGQALAVTDGFHDGLAFKDGEEVEAQDGRVHRIS